MNQAQRRKEVLARVVAGNETMRYVASRLRRVSADFDVSVREWGAKAPAKRELTSEEWSQVERSIRHAIRSYENAAEVARHAANEARAKEQGNG